VRAVERNVKYLAGSRFAHDRNAIQGKLRELTPFLGSLTESRADVAREIHVVAVDNKDNDKSVIVSIRDSYKDAYDEAQLCFSAMHELNIGFHWKIRVIRVVLRAEEL
jgi:hypothetical protein